jgi:tetratricopeptide (TPR) repeat protein
MFSQWKKILVVMILALIIYAGCNSQAILWAENALRKENPNFSMTPRFCSVLGNVAYLTFRYQLATDIIERNLHDFPYAGNTEDAHYRRAVCYEKMGKYDRAIQLYEDFLLNFPKSNRYDSTRNKIAKLKALHQQM